MSKLFKLLRSLQNFDFGRGRPRESRTTISGSLSAITGFSVTSGTAAIPDRCIVVALGGIVIEEWDELWKWTQKQRIASASAIKVVESTALNWRIVVAGVSSLYLCLESVRVKEAFKVARTLYMGAVTHREWHSVYRLEQAKLPSQTSILQSLEATEKAQQAHSQEQSRRSGLLFRLIHSGMKLQEKQYVLRFIVKHPEGSKEIATWRRSQLKALPQLEDLLGGVNPNANAEEDCLFLPSDVSLDERKRFTMDTLTSIERDLREEQANVAITSLCNSILHVMAAQDAKKEHARGVYQNMRATSNIRYMTYDKVYLRVKYDV
ncbi:hypothetical protein BDN70DRAFT_934935 [Pholiota conissans]|uniref:Uncharacterized protein n=1 Tax=Pholiota conissans TaxID=109636 RepID=A0A9P6CYE3_9AGAR|nr:hypothetical protein BDN70DRAFT_934935 [Pholiota conissans]